MIHIYDVTITRNVGELVKVKTTHGSKMLPKVKKHIKNIKFTGIAFLKVVLSCI